MNRNAKFQFILLNYKQKELSNKLFESSLLLFIPYGNYAYSKRFFRFKRYLKVTSNLNFKFASIFLTKPSTRSSIGSSFGVKVILNAIDFLPLST